MKKIKVDNFKVKVPADDITQIDFTVMEGSSSDIVDYENRDTEHQILLLTDKACLYVDEFRCANIRMDKDKMKFEGLMYDDGFPSIPVWAESKDIMTKELI